MPIKTRRLKKADREAGFFFMNDCGVDEFECETSLVATTPEARQHFFLFYDFPGFIGRAMNSKLFFKIFFPRNAPHESAGKLTSRFCFESASRRVQVSRARWIVFGNETVTSEPAAIDCWVDKCGVCLTECKFPYE